MKYWFFIFTLLFGTTAFAECKIGQQKFGVSSELIENKLQYFKMFEPIPNVSIQITTILEDFCPKLEESLAKDTLLYFHFVKNKLVAIQLERAEYDDLYLFQWARENFGILEDRKLHLEQQIIELETKERIIQLFLGVLPESIYQNVLIVSKQHNDLFQWLAKKEDAIDWENYENPEPKNSEGEN